MHNLISKAIRLIVHNIWGFWGKMDRGTKSRRMWVTQQVYIEQKERLGVIYTWPFIFHPRVLV